jgi:hypothetical protein
VAAAGAAGLGELFNARVLRALGAALLTGSGIQLIGYREPEGAYEEMGHQK